MNETRSSKEPEPVYDDIIELVPGLFEEFDAKVQEHILNPQERVELYARLFQRFCDEGRIPFTRVRVPTKPSSAVFTSREIFDGLDIAERYDVTE